MKKIIILLGPTSVGKTEVSIRLARLLDTEIISADSMQIYRHMDIGTAKPSKEFQQIVRHHMIDIVEPWESYSCGQYIADVRRIIDYLHQNGRVPLIVGGTGLYIRAMTRGLFEGPSADWELRNELLQKEEEDQGYLYRYLMTVDPVTASSVMPNDIRRIIRALEVYLKSNKRMSEMHRLLTRPLPYDFIKIGITRERRELYSMIEQRVDSMIKNGLVDEVRDVLDMINRNPGLLNASTLSSMQAIGYKEIAMHLSGEISLEDAVRLVKKRTKVYAKRQFTWFKKEDSIHWIDVTGIRDAEEILEKIKTVLVPLL